MFEFSPLGYDTRLDWTILYYTTPIEAPMTLNADNMTTATAPLLLPELRCPWPHFKTPQIPSNRDHKALNRGALEGLGVRYVQGVLLWLSKGDFEVSLGTAGWYRSTYGTDFDSFEIAGPVVNSI